MQWLISCTLLKSIAFLISSDLTTLKKYILCWWIFVQSLRILDFGLKFADFGLMLADFALKFADFSLKFADFGLMRADLGLILWILVNVCGLSSVWFPA